MLLLVLQVVVTVTLMMLTGMQAQVARKAAASRPKQRSPC